MNKPQHDPFAHHFFHSVGRRLVELAQPQPGDTLLAVGTGGGAVALYAALKVGPTGKVTGIERTSDLMGWAQQTVVAAGCANVELRQGELAEMQFADAIFDLVCCVSAFSFLLDLPAALRAWRRVLKPGGTVAFAGYGAQTFQPLSNLFEMHIRRYGVMLPAPARPFAWQHLTGLEHYSDLLRNAGFATIDVRSEQHGYDLAGVEEWWDLLWHSGFGGLLAQLPPETLAQFKTEHLAAVAELATAQGIGLHVATIFALGQNRNDHLSA